MEETKKKTSTKKKSSKSSSSGSSSGTEHKKKKKEKRIDKFVDKQQALAKQQAETLKQHSEKLNKPELATNPNAGRDNGALRLRLDLNLDADIKLKAKIRGSIVLTLQ